MPPLFPKHEPSKRFQRQARRDYDKLLLRLQRESYRLHEVKWSAPLIALEHPHQRGFLREFQLTPRASRRSDCAELEALLALISTRQYCRKGTFEEWSGKSKHYFPRTQYLRQPTLRSLLNAKVSESTLQHFQLPGGIRAKSRALIRRWINLGLNCLTDIDCPDYFELVIRPWIITHQKVNLPEVEARIDEIDHFLEHDGGWQKLSHLRGHRSSYWNGSSLTPQHRAITKFHTAEMRAAKFGFNDPESPPSSGFLRNIEFQKGTTKIVPFDFSDLSFPASRPYAA